MNIVNPATEGLITELAEDGPAEIADKVRRARVAQRAWAATPVAERLAIVRRFEERLVARTDELALTLTREMGKPVKQARNELRAMPGRIDFFLEHTAKVLDDEVVLRDAGTPPPPAGAPPALEERIAQEPLGVVANISAWNYPYFVGSNVFVPALLTGNAVVYKPSEHSTMTGLAIASLFAEAGLPPDLFLPIVGAGGAGRALLESPVDAVFFTGSYPTGRRIAEAAAPRLMKVQLELGGKDPVYVCDDADVAAAAESLADGAFYNTGQSCCSVERIYVHERIAAPFVEAFTAAVAGFVTGDPENEATYIGPLARREQLAVMDAQVADAQAKGARLLAGGARPPRQGYFYAPTVFDRVDQSMALMRDESFGPIIGIGVARDDDDAVRLMNDTEYGLTAGVYGPDRARAEAILRRVDAGSVYWNCCDRVSPRLPWTGRKHSGLGSTLSLAGIRTFVQPKAWHLRRA